MTIKINDCDTPIGCSEKSGTGFDVHLGVELLNSSTYENELDHSKLQGLHLPDQHPIGAIIDLRETLEDYDSRASILEDAANSLDARTDILENKATATESALTTVNTTLTTHKGRLDLHETRINEFVASDGETNAEVVDARTDKDGVTYGSLGARIMQSETQLDAVEAELDLKANQMEVTAALEVKADKSELTVKADKSELTPLQTELDAHDARITAEEAKSAANAAAFSVSGADATFNGIVNIKDVLVLPTGKAVGSYPVTAVIPSYGGTTSKWHTLYSFSGPNEDASLGLHGINFILSLSRSWNTTPPESYTFAVDISYGVATFTQLSGTTHQKLLYAIRVMKEDNLIQAGKKSLKVEVLATDSTGSNQWFASLHNVHAPEMTIKSHAFVPTNDAGTLAGQHVTNGGIVESGSNANGSWVKYFDGTLVQYFRKVFLSTYVTQVMTYPVPFVDTTHRVVFSLEQNSRPQLFVGQSGLATSGVTMWVTKVGGGAPGFDCYVDAIAIGKWR